MIKPTAKLLIVAAAAALGLAPLVANAGEVHNRIVRQNQRINQGVKSGELTYAEYHRLDRSADRINAQRRADLRANGGRLTPAEAAQLNREQNRLSDRISFDKHNAAEQPGSP
ncbi:MAG: hypothetical protein NVSMB64_17520 [Candidatus Velthaea sp.]